MFKLLFDTPLFSKYGLGATLFVLAIFFSLGDYPILQNSFVLCFLVWSLVLTVMKRDYADTKWSKLMFGIGILGQFMLVVATTEDLMYLF